MHLRLGTSVCQVTRDEKELELIAPDRACNLFLLSCGCHSSGYYRVAHGTALIPNEAQFLRRTLVARLVRLRRPPSPSDDTVSGDVSLKKKPEQDGPMAYGAFEVEVELAKPMDPPKAEAVELGGNVIDVVRESDGAGAAGVFVEPPGDADTDAAVPPQGTVEVRAGSNGRPQPKAEEVIGGAVVAEEGAAGVGGVGAPGVGAGGAAEPEPVAAGGRPEGTEAEQADALWQAMAADEMKHAKGLDNAEEEGEVAAAGDAEAPADGTRLKTGASKAERAEAALEGKAGGPGVGRAERAEGSAEVTAEITAEAKAPAKVTPRTVVEAVDETGTSLVPAPVVEVVPRVKVCVAGGGHEGWGGCGLGPLPTSPPPPSLTPWLTVGPAVTATVCG